MSGRGGRHRQGDEPDLNALAAWVDGRIDPGERADLAGHLAACPQCRTIVAELARGGAPAVRARRSVMALAATVAASVIGGGTYLVMHQRERPSDIPPPLTLPRVPAAAAAPPTPSAPSTGSPAASPAPPARTPDRKRAAGTTSVQGKRFHLVAGEWIDDAYRESGFLPVVQVSSRAQMDAIPALRRYATLGSRFTVAIGGTVYRVSIP